MVSQAQTKQSRNFFCVTYLTDEQVAEFCQRSDIMHYAYIKHDKDDKAPHTHILLRFNNNRSLQSVTRIFKEYGKGKDNGKDVNTMVEIAEDLTASFDYLTHKNQPEKHQYEDDEVISDDVGYFRGIFSSAPKNEENTAFQILMDMESGTSLRELARRYGREIIINFGRYNDFLLIMKERERQEKEREFTKVINKTIAEENLQKIEERENAKNKQIGV